MLKAVEVDNLQEMLDRFECLVSRNEHKEKCHLAGLVEYFSAAITTFSKTAKKLPELVKETVASELKSNISIKSSSTNEKIKELES